MGSLRENVISKRVGCDLHDRQESSMRVGPMDHLRVVIFYWVAINLIDTSIQIDKQIEIRYYSRFGPRLKTKPCWSKQESQ